MTTTHLCSYARKHQIADGKVSRQSSLFELDPYNTVMCINVCGHKLALRHTLPKYCNNERLSFHLI